MSEEKSAISPELTREIVSLLRERWQDYLASGESIEVDGDYVGTELFVRIGLIHGPGGADYQLAAGLDWEDNALTRESAVEVLLDLLDGYLGDFLENERDEKLPLDWQPIEIEGRTLRVRGSLTYPNLESKADGLLKEPEAE